MKAVIQTGGKQYLVEPGQVLTVELLETSKSQPQFEPLLVIDGDKIAVGRPSVDSLKVKAEIVGEVKADKIKVLKFKAKKRVKRLTGHRQRLVELKIISIG